ncbi:MAG: D-glycerate dehydrogenase [Deltaproteobacteria bacterium]|nr:D-glycerate dehydrogenase [Deltaproteobacteria bacterium]MBI3064306.1 D-glycerate dehydrogenase [Deltaproteobacteria bacterium]
MAPRIFVTQPIPEKALAQLREHGSVELNGDSAHIITKPELMAAIKRNDYLFCLLHDTVDAEVINASPNLKLIASMATTPAGIDVAAATARRIPVTRNPPLVTEATADLHWALLLAVARRIVEADRALRSGLFPGGQSIHFLGGEVNGKTLGIVGLGAIGEAVARRARGFAMRILYTKRHRLEERRETELGVEYRSLDDLLSESDFVSINAALSPETVHLIGERELRRMRPSAYLVNTARGPIVDEKALVEALEEKKIAGAALDVYEREPMVEPGLINLPNVVLTPHLGSAARETRERAAAIVVENILAVIDGRRPPNLYNPEVYGT